MSEAASAKANRHDLVVTRIFDAPLELLWKAWTEAEHVQRWWGPKDYISPFCQIDLRVGGKYLFCMRAPDYQGGVDYYSGGAYQKIVPMELLEFTQDLTDKEGNIIDPAQVGMPPDFPRNLLVRVTFKALAGNRTELTVIEYDWPEGQMREMSRLGMEQSLDKIAEVLKKGA